MRKTNHPIFLTLAAACAETEIEPCSKRRRFDRTASIANGKRTLNAGSIYWFPDGSGGICFNWQTGRIAIFYYDYNGRKLSREEKRKINEEIKAQRKRFEAELRARYYAVSLLATSIWDVADLSVTGHAYLVRKCLPQSHTGLRCISRVKAQGLINQAAINQEDGEGQVLRAMGRLLVVPLTDENGLICSLQLIDESGRKTFLKGGRKKGLLWRPENLSFNAGNDGVIGIAEGVATAMSVTAMCSVPCVAAIDAGNLLPAAETLRKVFPKHSLTFYADKDVSRVGEEKAKEAARLLIAQGAQCRVLLPAFDDHMMAAFTQRTGKAPTDFNDLWVYEFQGGVDE